MANINLELNIVICNDKDRRIKGLVSHSLTAVNASNLGSRAVELLRFLVPSMGRMLYSLDCSPVKPAKVFLDRMLTLKNEIADLNCCNGIILRDRPSPPRLAEVPVIVWGVNVIRIKVSATSTDLQKDYANVVFVDVPSNAQSTQQAAGITSPPAR